MWVEGLYGLSIVTDQEYCFVAFPILYCLFLLLVGGGYSLFELSTACGQCASLQSFMFLKKQLQA